MKIIPCKDRFNINNIDELTVDNVKIEEGKHGMLFPNTVRCILSGPSNCGKTNVVFNLVVNPNGLRFNNLYIFSKSFLQPKYQLLDKIFSEVKDVGYFKYDASNAIMQPDQAKPYSLFIFDDISCENHDTIRNYFAMGRHNEIDCIYIGQTYSKIPKQLIRDNVNIIVIFKQDDTNLKHIYNDHVGTDMTYEKFKHICNKAWEKKYGFFVVNKDCEKNGGRYKIGFDQCVLID